MGTEILPRVPISSALTDHCKMLLSNQIVIVKVVIILCRFSFLKKFSVSFPSQVNQFKYLKKQTKNTTGILKRFCCFDYC